MQHVTTSQSQSQSQSRSRSRSRSILVVALAFALTAGVTSCAALLPKAPPPASASSSPTSAAGSDTSKPDTAEHQADVFSLAVGDCLNDAGPAAVSDVPKVDCAAPHDFEVFYEFELPDSSYPGDDALGTTAEAGCKQPFADFTGIDYDSSVLGYTEFTPTESSWQSGDRKVSCIVGEPDTKTTGTLKGANR